MGPLRFSESSVEKGYHDHSVRRRTWSKKSLNILALKDLGDFGGENKKEDLTTNLPRTQNTKRSACNASTSHLGCQALGGHPKPDCSQFYVRRKDPLTRALKTVPRMVFNAEANRGAVPEHQLLEDDWRAYRSALHNQKSVYSAGAGEYSARPHGMKEVQTYVNAVPSPYGYMYRRIANYQTAMSSMLERQQQKQQEQQLQDDPAALEEREARVPLTLPVIDTRDPFKKYHVGQQEGQQTGVFDADAILVAGLLERTTIYNEPDSVPCSVAHDDFRRSLPERTVREVGVDRHGDNKNSRLRIGASRFELPTQKATTFDEPKLGRGRSRHAFIDETHRHKKMKLFEQTKNNINITLLKKKDT